MRFLGMLRADESTEANEPPSAELVKAMGDFIEEATDAGVLLATDGLHPTSRGARVRLENGKVTVTDGPFTESKELVASYALMKCDTMEEVIEWTKRFLAILGGGEVEIRQILEPTDFSPDIFPPEEQAREEAVRARMARNS